MNLNILFYKSGISWFVEYKSEVSSSMVFNKSLFLLSIIKNPSSGFTKKVSGSWETPNIPEYMIKSKSSSLLFIWNLIGVPLISDNKKLLFFF